MLLGTGAEKQAADRCLTIGATTEHPPEHIECESGDSFLVDLAADGSILLTLDDVDDTEVPTGRLSAKEAERLGVALARAAIRSHQLPRR